MHERENRNVHAACVLLCFALAGAILGVVVVRRPDLDLKLDLDLGMRAGLDSSLLEV